MESFGDIIGLLIIVGVVALKAIGSVLSGQQKQKASPRSGGSGDSSTGDSDGGFSWEDWGWEAPASSAPSAPSAPAQTAPAPMQEPPTERSAPAAEQAPAGHESWAASSDSYAWDAPAAPKLPEQPDSHQEPYQYSTGQAHASVEDLKPAEATGWGSASAIADESFQYAFPEAVKKVRRLRRGTRRPILLDLKGRKDVRRGFLLREVLMQPRAYDL